MVAMMSNRSPWTDLTLADAAERLLTWAGASVPFARRTLDQMLTAPWRSFGAGEWRQAAARLLMTNPMPTEPSADGSVANGAAATWLQTLRDTLDPAIARRILTDQIPGLTSAGATHLLKFLHHPCTVAGGPLKRTVKRLAGGGDGSKFLSALARSGGLVPAQTQQLVVWLGGGSDPSGNRAPAPALCGPRPRCGACPVAVLCPSSEQVNVAKDEPCAGTGSISQESVERSVRITDLPPESRPRERLIRGEYLDVADLLAILIKSGTSQHSALDLAREVLRRHPTLHSLASAPVEEIAAISGLGLAKAATLRAALELGRRAAQETAAPVHRSQVAMDSSQRVMNHYRSHFVHLNAEVALLLLLNVRLQVIREVTLARGTLDSVPIHPRELFVEAIRSRAHRVILMHNHPSGDPTPSRSDCQLTARLLETGVLVGIPLADHIIVGAGTHYSFADHNWAAVSGYSK
jgi:DNA repair protein RadC